MSQIALFGLSAILTALALVVWRARPQHSVNRWFASKAVCLACWVSGIGGLQGGTDLDAWGRFTIASATLIPATFLGFTRCYPTPSRWPSSRLVWSTLVIGVVLATLSLTTSLAVYDNVLTTEGLTRKSGPLHHVFVVYLIVVLAAGLGVFIDKWRQARGLARAQLQYLGAGIIVAAAAPEVPQALLQQLASGGRMIVPVGADNQVLCLIEKTSAGLTEKWLDAVRFVPLRGGRQ